MVEFNGATPSEATLDHLLAELDTRLSRLNVEYADKRKSERLKAPTLCVMRTGWFERKASAALRNSARDVQFKAQLLSATPEDPSEIISMIKYSNSAEISKKQD